MENFYLSNVVAEVAKAACNRILRRVWQSGNCLFFDFGLSRSFKDVLVASLDPASPSLFLYRPSRKSDSERLPRRRKDETISPFLLLLRSRTIGARFAAVRKRPNDRVVTLEFENGPDIANPTAALQLAFTGRSSNARLIGTNGGDESVLRKTKAAGENTDARDAANVLDLETALITTLPDSSVESILTAWFGTTSPLGPLMKGEFLARAESMTPAAAFTTLVEDILRNPHSALLYSKVPLEQMGREQIKPGRDLILAPFKLASAGSFPLTQFSTFSEAATEYWLALERSQEFQREYQAVTSHLSGRLKSLNSTLHKIESDLARFEDPEKFKRYGDLILANLGSSRIEDGKIRLKDYFEGGEPEIEIDSSDAKTLQEAASHYYDLYRKGRRTKEMLTPRGDQLKLEIRTVESLLSTVKSNPPGSVLDETLIKARKALGLDEATSRSPAGKRNDKARKTLGRRFMSSDGYEIVVGRNDAENDQITFRLAGSQDIWLHAADYPGSHVVIRNPTRKPVAYRTIVEAAELTAFHSQAKREGKVAVNHTQKKFVSKPPKAKPGLVRLSSFKTVLVEPRCDLKRVID